MRVTSALCPAGCGYQAIMRPSGVVLASDPPLSAMEWWCACGFRAPAPAEPDRSDEWTRDVWNAAQRAAEYEREKVAERSRPWWKVW